MHLVKHVLVVMLASTDAKVTSERMRSFATEYMSAYMGYKCTIWSGWLMGSAWMLRSQKWSSVFDKVYAVYSKCLFNVAHLLESKLCKSK